MKIPEDLTPEQLTTIIKLNVNIAELTLVEAGVANKGGRCHEINQTISRLRGLLDDLKLLKEPTWEDISTVARWTAHLSSELYQASKGR